MKNRRDLIIGIALFFGISMAILTGNMTGSLDKALIGVPPATFERFYAMAAYFLLSFCGYGLKTIFFTVIFAVPASLVVEHIKHPQ